MNKKIVTVMKKGGDFTLKDFFKLKNNIEKYNDLTDIDIHCLTDEKQNFDEKIPLKYKFEKWWSKIEIFNKNLWEENDKILYLDLDTVVVGNFVNYIFDIEKKFVAVNDVYRKKKDRNALQSSIMLFDPNYSEFLYNDFIKDPEFYKKKYSALGDQKFIEESLKRKNNELDFFDYESPGKIVSYKNDCCFDRKGRNFKGVPEQADIVMFHGKPRPSEVNWIGN